MSFVFNMFKGLFSFVVLVVSLSMIWGLYFCKICLRSVGRFVKKLSSAQQLKRTKTLVLLAWIFLIIGGRRNRTRNWWVISPWWQRCLRHSKLIRLAPSPLLITRENQSSFLRPIRGDWTRWVRLGVLIGTNVIAFSRRSQFVRLYAMIVCNAFRGTKMHPVCLAYIRVVTQSHDLYLYLVLLLHPSICTPLFRFKPNAGMAWTGIHLNLFRALFI